MKELAYKSGYKKEWCKATNEPCTLTIKERIAMFLYPVEAYLGEVDCINAITLD